MHKTKASKHHQRLRFRAANSKASAAIALTLTILLAGATVANPATDARSGCTT